MVIAAQNTNQKPGYKQTEVGIIPVDWEVKKLGEIVNKERPICYGIVQTGKSVDNGISCIRVVDLNEGKIIKENLITTSKDISNSYKRTILKEGDLVIALRGKIGELAKIDKELIGSNLTRGIALIAVNDSLDSPFFLQQLSSSNSKIIFEKNLNGSALQEIPINVLRKILVAYPPTKLEQTAIATVLSDTDSLITSLDQLIAKKRDIKQATMQQLLTGKTRLPGFSEKWVVKKLGEVIEFTNGKPYEKFVCDDGKYFLITLDSISIAGKIKKEHKRVNFLDGSLCKNDIVIILSDIAHGNFLGLCDLIPEDNKYLLNQRVGRLKTIATMNPKFLSLLINSSQDHFKKRGQGTSQRHIYKRDIEELSILIPKIEEQTAIATVLSDMDAEIAALEQKRDKIRALKQGMMQELLTGKTRLL